VDAVAYCVPQRSGGYREQPSRCWRDHSSQDATRVTNDKEAHKTVFFSERLILLGTRTCPLVSLASHDFPSLLVWCLHFTVCLLGALETCFDCTGNGKHVKVAAFAFSRSWRTRVMRSSAFAAAGLPSQLDYRGGAEHPSAFSGGLGWTSPFDLKIRTRRGSWLRDSFILRPFFAPFAR